MKPQHTSFAKEMNQCDGCARGLPVKKATLEVEYPHHYLGETVMPCTAKREEGTPRTDAQERSASSMATYPNKVVKASFARGLEIELTDLQGRLDDATGMLHGEHDSRMEAEAKLTERDALLLEILVMLQRNPDIYAGTIAEIRRTLEGES